jgi:hypothetical protein
MTYILSFVALLAFLVIGDVAVLLLHSTCDNHYLRPRDAVLPYSPVLTLGPTRNRDTQNEAETSVS